jgi:inward rectifier potassium channel
MKHLRSRHEKYRPLTAEALRRIERRGISRHGLKDLYYDLVTIRLDWLLLLMTLYFLMLNLGFAGLYCAIGGLGGGTGHGRFGDALFFSVQTLSTTGYGTVYPVSAAANIVASGEIMFGQLNTALATGVLFARISRPRPRVLFSKVLVVREIGGVPTVMFRVANERRSAISEARISVVVTNDEDDGEGGRIRRFLPLKLERDETPVFALSWLVVHKVLPDSPLYGKNRAELEENGNVLVCSLTGTDEAVGATVSVRHVYGAEDVLFNHRFVDVITHGEDGDVAIDYRRFHEVVPYENTTKA